MSHLLQSEHRALGLPFPWGYQQDRGQPGAHLHQVPGPEVAYLGSLSHPYCHILCFYYMKSCSILCRMNWKINQIKLNSSPRLFQEAARPVGTRDRGREASALCGVPCQMLSPASVLPSCTLVFTSPLSPLAL